MTIQDLSARLAGLAVFRELLADPVIKEYAGLLRALASGAGREQTAAAAGRVEAGPFAADTGDVHFAAQRRRFLTEQGYSYSIEVR